MGPGRDLSRVAFVEVSYAGLKLVGVGVFVATREADEFGFVLTDGCANVLYGLRAVLMIEEVAVDCGQANGKSRVCGGGLQGGLERS